MDDEEAELRNPFPSPPSHYNNYTTHNLSLLSLLKERAAEKGVDVSEVNQYEILSDQSDLPEWPLTQLEKPRVDWILEEGQYTVFGDTWFVKETIPSLAEMGGHQLYPADPSIDRRPALLTILKSMLVAYSHLLNALLAPPPTTSSTVPPDYPRYLEWITVMAQNIMAAANDMRPVQARGNLELMMQRQLELRKEETRTIHAKCDELEAKLEQLSLLAQRGADGDVVKKEVVEAMSGKAEENLLGGASNITINPHDVLCWAEESAEYDL
ncbi:hypothetical protein NM688_g2237 [Phlebia brevispora]|uniref:Uncharacterized protein n=1 Tax=Phlebia brevispora TaxID=194682 RepID=A0ACC1T9B4_9APHY|nr:hypothetical protein NM688_g2237 [Phlebia brevispora]